ncbi:MAG: DUF2252 domain-containing protein, partial [Algiphilus sp.]
QLTRQNRGHWMGTAIAAQNAGLSVQDRQRKYAAMAESPYRFFRGTSHLFWADLYKDWRFTFFGGTAASQTWIQGDAHVYNFGAFANHEGEVIFGLDDFDDAIVSDYQYDLWRLAISVVLDARQHGRFDEAVIAKALRRLAKGYLKTVTEEDPPQPETDIHFTADTTAPPLNHFLKKTARKKSREKMLGKWTRLQKNGKRVFDTDNPKLKRLSPTQRKAFIQAFTGYQDALQQQLGQSGHFFRIKDIARRELAGTGSLGTPRYYVLIEGEARGEHDDIILDVKRQDGPAALAAMNAEERDTYHAVFAHEGERHATAFRALAEHPDQYLGWLRLADGVYSVRERSPFKQDFPTETLDRKKDFWRLARQWGEVLATEHRRAGRALNADAPCTFEQELRDRTAGREAAFDRLLVAIATHYADCVTADHARFCSTLR